MFGCIGGQATPSATHIQDPHTGLKLKFTADQIHLGFLGLIQVTGILPVGTRVVHPFIQHQRKQVVTDVVMATADGKGPKSARRASACRFDRHQRVFNDFFA
jgi:hypothetical protein